MLNLLKFKLLVGAMKHRIVIPMLFMLIFSLIFAMSGDGENEPDKENCSAKQEVIKKATFIDEFGIDTDMTQDEFEIYKSDFTKRYGNSFFNSKIDPKKIPKLVEFGLDSPRFHFPLNKLHIKNTLFSNIIIVGRTLKRNKDYKGLDSLEIEEILKGEEIIFNKLGEIPKFIQYTYGVDSGSDIDPVTDVRCIYFFGGANILSKEKPRFYSLIESTLINIKDDLAYPEYIYFMNESRISMEKRKAETGDSKSWYILETFDQVICNIKQVIEVIDHKNFYKNTRKRK